MEVCGNPSYEGASVGWDAVSNRPVLKTEEQITGPSRWKSFLLSVFSSCFGDASGLCASSDVSKDPRSNREAISPFAECSVEHSQNVIVSQPLNTTLRSQRSYGGSTLCQSSRGGRRDSLTTNATTDRSISNAISDTTSVADLDIEGEQARQTADEDQLAGNKLSDSNIPTRARILCAGSGAVAWGREIAMNDPLSEVVVLTTEPYSTYLPKNCTVEEGNIVEYDQDGWDHVFIRNNRAVAHWGRYLIHLNNITRPGGRIELVDIDDKKGAVCTCAKHPSQWARAKRNRCRTCLEFPSVKARKDTLKASGFSELNIVYHGRMRRTRDGTMVYSASIISTACSNAQQQTESQSKSQTHCHG